MKPENKFSKKISTEEFADFLAEGLRRMRSRNIETLGKLLETVKQMNDEELMKLDCELSIVDMFIITYCCRLHFHDETICNKILDSFHEFAYHDFSQNDLMLAHTFHKEGENKYQSYFEAMRSEESVLRLCKELEKNIYGKELHSAIILGALSIYIEGNLKYVSFTIDSVLKEYRLQ